MTRCNLVAWYHLFELTVAFCCPHFLLYPIYVLSHFYLRLFHPEMWGSKYISPKYCYPVSDKGTRNTVVFVYSYQIKHFKIIYIQSNEIHNIVALIKFLLVLRCQLYMFRTVTVLPKTLYQLDVSDSAFLITYHSLHIQYIQRSS